jgi:hypothetical protein
MTYQVSSFPLTELSFQASILAVAGLVVVAHIMVSKLDQKDLPKELDMIRLGYRCS